MIARRIVVRGRVQGVGFRYSMVDAAAALGIDGWTRNRKDGSVEAFVQGDTAAVERAIAWCRHGPPGARVTEIDVDDAAVDPQLSGFATRPTL
jgi:acylphosphatase